MSATAQERFQNRLVRIPNGCWILRGTLSTEGYSLIRDNKFMYAHRWAYTHYRGPIPEGTELDHLCRNRPCVNPQHLDPVPHLVNVARGDGAARLACVNGHQMTSKNSYRRLDNGARQCRRCKADREWARRRRLGMVKSAEVDAAAIDLSA